MQPHHHFYFCPKCGESRLGTVTEGPFRCGACGFLYYFNPTVAVGAFIADPQGRRLFIRRAKDPAQGKLAVPGGFVDIGESAEDALRREIREEVNLEVGPVEFLCSFPNDYLYAGVTYPVVDFYFTADASRIESIAALDGVESYVWMRAREVDLEEIAFPSARVALELLRRREG
jgi:ADP-ribose pyrophosphatase YjhB (NUDIX family)